MIPVDPLDVDHRKASTARTSISASHHSGITPYGAIPNGLNNGDGTLKNMRGVVEGRECDVVEEQGSIKLRDWRRGADGKVR